MPIKQPVMPVDKEIEKLKKELNVYPGVIGIGRVKNGFVVYVDTATNAKFLPEELLGKKLSFSVVGGINAQAQDARRLKEHKLRYALKFLGEYDCVTRVVAEDDGTIAVTLTDIEKKNRLPTKIEDIVIKYFE